ncbi:iso-1-cytochrome c [Sparganum proliferum]
MSAGGQGFFTRFLGCFRPTRSGLRIGCYRALAVAGATAFGAAVLATPVLATELVAHPTKLPWPQKGPLAAHDHAALRRGYQVYKQVCAACHSMKFLSYRQLVGHVLTEDEAKADSAEILVEDGPDDTGKMFMRPGRLSDLLPSPYPNPEAARAANGGALPPDLTFIARARHGFEDYIFHLLTGFCDPPPGRKLDENQYYNPYFPGGALGMAPPLYDEAIEYDDGTPATVSQMAKDVVCYLSWSSERNHDKRKRVLFKAVIILAIGSVLAGVYKRKKWANIKTRKLMYKNRPVPKDL